MLIALDGISTPISLRSCDRLVAPLAEVLGSWRFLILDSSDQASAARPAISVTGDGNCFRIAAPGLGEAVVERSEVGAVFSLTAELARAFAEENPKRPCFHCAAVEIGGRLVVFPNTGNSGKSTLAAKLASAGLRIFADDVLPISETGQQATALGTAPRLRLPLPATAGAAFREFVQAHRGPHDREFVYLALPASLLAPHGEVAPIGAVVVLDRRRSAPARLTAVARAQGLQQLLVQNFAPGGTSTSTLDRLNGLVEQVPCFALTYADLGEAADLLRDRFSSNGASWRNTGEAAAAGGITVAVEVPSGRIQGRRFEQSPGVALRAVDDDLFLVRPGEDAVFQLNPVAASLWRLLEQPTTMATAAAVLHQAFPSGDPRRIKRDVRALFDTLREDGLIRLAPGP